MNKRRLLVFAGGQSPEHTISLLSTKSLVQALAGSPIQVDVIVITKQGRWLDRESSRAQLTQQEVTSGGHLPMQQAHLLHEYDCVMSLIHGPTGEDGCMQGLFEIANVPYLGAGVLSSAICMDKATAKDIARSANIPQVPYCTFYAHQLRKDAQGCIDHICQTLKSPWFVKPSSSGSSIGITRVTQKQGLTQAIEDALAIDPTIVVEQGVQRPRELEVAVLGGPSARVSVVGEIRYQATFYDYHTKYTPGQSSMHLPAEIADNLRETIQALAQTIFHVFRLHGFARLDFLYDEANQAVYLSEINTLPGFTPFSMFPLLWEKTDLPYLHMMQTLMDLAQQRHQARPSTSKVL